jgi:chloramphenicol 3-O-phosphotransferase
VAALLASRFARGVHVHGDVFRRMIVSGQVAMSPDASEQAWAQLRLRYQLGAQAADAYARAGYTVVVQDVVAGPVLSEYVDLLESRPLVVVVLAPRADVVAAREAARAKTGYDNGWAIEQFDDGFRRTTPHIGLWIDSSDQTPDQTVDEILDREAEGTVP